MLYYELFVFYRAKINKISLQLKNKDVVINQRELDKQKVKEKYNSKIQAETDKMSKELESKLRRQRELLQVFNYIHIHFTWLLILVNV